MAAKTYYVHGTLGSDLNDGLNTSTSFATITKATQTVAASDTVYIAPGTYREQFTLTTAGTAGNYISYIGDYNATIFTASTPGYIRVTGCDINENPAATTTIIDLNSKDYQIFQNIVVDGIKDSTTGKNGMTTTNCPNSIIDRCLINTGYYGIAATINYNDARTTVSRSYCTGVIAGIAGVHGYNSVLQGTQYGSYFGNTYGCVLNGYIAGNRQGKFAYNNITLNSNYGLYQVTSASNNIAYHCGNGLYSVTLATNIKSHISIGCVNGIISDLTTNIDNLYCIECNLTASAASSPYVTGTAKYGKHIGYSDIMKYISIAKSIRFDNFYETFADNTATWTGRGDCLLGYAITQSDDSQSCGPCTPSNVSYDYVNYKTYSPSIKIINKGQEIISFAVKSGSSHTSSAWIKTNGTARIVASSPADTFTKVYGTTLSGSDWEYTTISFQPTQDCLTYLYLESLTTGSTISASFSDIRP